MTSKKNKLDDQSDMAEVLKASQPYGLVSMTTAAVATALSSKIISTSLNHLEKLGLIQAQPTAKIEKKGRPEKVYCLTSNGVTWLQANGFEHATVLAMPDPLDLAHRYCQALVGVQSSAKVEVEKIIPLLDGRYLRFDVCIPIRTGEFQFIEVEQNLERKNMVRAIEKFRAISELFNDQASRRQYSPDVLFVFNLSAANLPKTLNVWQDALAIVFPWDAPLPFTPRYTTIDAFVYDPAFENISCFPLIEKTKGKGAYLVEASISGNLFDARLTPSIAKMLAELPPVQDQEVDASSPNTDQLLDLCKLATRIYSPSMGSNGPTRRYSTFPHESIQMLKHFLHLPQNAGLLQALKESMVWIESRKSGLLVYRDAATRLIWDVFLRYFGFGRGGALHVFVKVPDAGETFSEIKIDAHLSGALDPDDKIYVSSSINHGYEDALSWVLTALFTYQVELGLSASLWPSPKWKGRKKDGSAQ